MLGVLDATVHVHAALAASVTLDGGIGIDDLELVRIFRDSKLVASHHRDLREHRAGRFPAFGASAYVIEGGLRGDGHLYGVARTFALKRAAREARRALLDPIIDCGMNRD